MTLLLLSAVLIQTGGMRIGLGLLAEVLTRIDMDGRDRRIDTLASQAPLPVVQPRPVLVQGVGSTAVTRRAMEGVAVLATALLSGTQGTAVTARAPAKSLSAAVAHAPGTDRHGRASDRRVIHVPTAESFGVPCAPPRSRRPR
jgi:hypothetical protein